MKMNSLAALRGVCDKVGSAAGEAMLEAFKPRAYKETVGGRTMAQVMLPPLLACPVITARMPPSLAIRRGGFCAQAAFERHTARVSDGASPFCCGRLR